MTGLSRQITLVLATALTLVMNYLSQSLPLFGRTNADVSDALPNAFTPAGLTFAIWGVIFTGLIVFAVYQALPTQRGERYDRLFWPYLLSNLLNASWLLAFQSLNLGVSVLIMLALLATLIWLDRTLRGMNTTNTLTTPPPNRADFWALQVPTSLYLGWISVATMANITAYLVSQGVTGGLLGLSPQAWSAALLVIAGIVGTLMLTRYRDYAFAGVLLWAFLGVYLARPDAGTVTVGVVIGAALVVLAALRTLSMRRPHTAAA